MPRFLRALVAALVAAAVTAACGGNIEDTLDEYLPKREPAYKSSKRLPPLEVPPDLSRTTIKDTMAVPEVRGEGTTFSAYSGAAREVAARPATGVLPDFGSVRVERTDDERWLVVTAPPSQVWPKVRDFWLEQGFAIEMEDPTIGIMETDWAEQRADLRSGLIDRFMSRLSSALYGAATRDKFRTRLERGSDRGTTEIYVSHRGAEEVTTTAGGRARSEQYEQKVWQPRPSDPELEAEMLNRMLVYFGVSEDEASKLLTEGRKRPDRARIVRESNGLPVLSLDEDFSRAWRRTGLALDRVGFTVEDRDRSRGLYFVRYVDPDRDLGQEKKGFFSRLKFWEKDRPPAESEYLISLIGGERSTQVIVLNKTGERDTSPTASRILGLLREQLR